MPDIRCTHVYLSLCVYNVHSTYMLIISTMIVRQRRKITFTMVTMPTTTTTTTKTWRTMKRSKRKKSMDNYPNWCALCGFVAVQPHTLTAKPSPSSLFDVLVSMHARKSIRNRSIDRSNERSFEWYGYGVDGSWFSCWKIIITINRYCTTYFISLYILNEWENTHTHMWANEVHFSSMYAAQCTPIFY